MGKLRLQRQGHLLAPRGRLRRSVQAPPLQPTEKQASRGLLMLVGIVSGIMEVTEVDSQSIFYNQTDKRRYTVRISKFPFVYFFSLERIVRKRKRIAVVNS